MSEDPSATSGGPEGVSFQSSAPTNPQEAFTGLNLENTQLQEERDALLGQADLTHQLAVHGAEKVIAEQLKTAEALAAAGIDPLTGALNRRGAQRILEVQEHRSTPRSVLFVDLDRFREINTRYGHDAGDTALKQAAGAIAGSLREGDTLIRWGGEEFVVILQGINGVEAEVVAERVRVAMEQKQVASGHNLSCSIGVREWASGLKGPRVIADADAAMYVAKQAGRNRVQLWSAAQFPRRRSPKIIGQ